MNYSQYLHKACRETLRSSNNPKANGITVRKTLEATSVTARSAPYSAIYHCSRALQVPCVYLHRWDVLNATTDKPDSRQY